MAISINISKWIFFYSKKWPFLTWIWSGNMGTEKKFKIFLVSRAFSSPLCVLWVTGSRHWDKPQEEIRLPYPTGLLRPVYLWNSRIGSKHSGSNIPNSKLYVYDFSFSSRWLGSMSRGHCTVVALMSPRSRDLISTRVSFSNVISVIRTGVRNTTSAQPVLWRSNGMRCLKNRGKSPILHRFSLNLIDCLIGWLINLRRKAASTNPSDLPLQQPHPTCSFYPL